MSYVKYQWFNTANDYDYFDKTSLDNEKQILDNSTELPYMAVKLEADNTFSFSFYMGSKASYDERLRYKIIAFYDSFVNQYYYAKVVNIDYQNQSTAVVRAQVLPLHTYYLNNSTYVFDGIAVKTPIQPTGSDNIAQTIVAEHNTIVNYAGYVRSAVSSYLAEEKALVVFKIDMSVFGITPFMADPSFPSGRIELDRMPSSFSARFLGQSLPGFPVFFSNIGTMQNFFDRMSNSNVVIKRDIVQELFDPAEYAAYEAQLASISASLSGTDRGGQTVADAVFYKNITKVFTPYSLDDIVAFAKSIPNNISGAQEDVIEKSFSIPVATTGNSYFDLASLLQTKLVFSNGMVFTIDKSNILYQDNNPSPGFQCKAVISYNGIDIQVGTSSYTMNFCEFPEVSINGAVNNIRTQMSVRNGVDLLKTAGLSALGSGIDRIMTNSLDVGNNILKGFGYTDNSSNIQAGSGSIIKALTNRLKTDTGISGLEKNAVIGSSATYWTRATDHLEITMLSSASRERHNSIYKRFGYTDYRLLSNQNVFDLNGYYKFEYIQTTTSDNYITNNIFENSKQQLMDGIYFNQ